MNVVFICSRGIPRATTLSVNTDILKFQIIFYTQKKSMRVVGVDFPPLHIRPTHIGQLL